MRGATKAALLAALLIAAQARADSSWTLTVFGMYGDGIHKEGQGFAKFGTLGVRAGRPLSQRLTFLVEAHPAFTLRQPAPDGGRQTVSAFALDVGLRLFLGPARWRAHPYLELLDGPFYALARTPESGTRFNFLTQFGGGVVLPLGETWHPSVGLRWVHISNAGLGDHNPDWDFQSIAFGVTRRLGR
jgi:hypothetical protein